MTPTLIAIIGLAGLEKGRLTHDLADALSAQGHTVSILDNSENNPMTAPQTHRFRRVTAPITGALHEALTDDADVVLLNAGESLNPETLYRVVYDGVSRAESATSRPIEVRVLAIADDRTCDCFPHLRAQMEHHADLTLRYPFALEEALAIL